MRSLAKSSPGLTRQRPVAAVVHQMAGKHHFHCCTTPTCKRAFGCRCDAPETNGLCHDCRGTSRPIWEVARDPKACCVKNTKPVTNADDLGRYDLAGPGPWFQCRTCARCHGYPITTLEEEA